MDMDLVKCPSTKQQCNRRKLPDTCVSFSSPEGIRLFTEALPTGHMNCYFKLASQFRTQDVPELCSLTTLVMILNALEIDPGRIWKEPWRWYHESMLDWCNLLKEKQQDGITFHQFLCLANCNGIDANAVRADCSATENDFRRKVQECSRRDDCFLVCSYSRKELQQTGDGQFSAIGGYHPYKDMVFLLDTERTKYPPHWISVSQLWQSMEVPDQLTDQPRGYITVSRLDKNPLLLPFRISPVFNICLRNGFTKEMSSFVESWQSWLSKTHCFGFHDIIVDIRNNYVFEALIKEAIIVLQRSLNCLIPDQFSLTTKFDSEWFKDIWQKQKCVVQKILEELEQSNLFQTVDQVLDDIPMMNFENTGRLTYRLQDTRVPEMLKCGIFSKIRPSHFVTIFLLCWPYDISTVFNDRTNAFLLNDLLPSISASGQCPLVVDEVILLRKQLHVMLTFFNQSKQKDFRCSS